MGRTSSGASLAELLEDDVRLEPSDAVAIVREVCARVSGPASGTLRGESTDTEGPAVPLALTPGRVWLDSDARLRLAHNVGRTPADVGALLEVLVEAAHRTGSDRVSGPLLLTMTRATGRDDAPPFESVAELSKALERFDAPDRAGAIRDLLDRWNRMSQPGAAARAAPAPDSAGHEVPRLTTRTGRRRLPFGAAWVAVAAAVGLPAGIMVALSMPSLIRKPVPERPAVTAEKSTAAEGHATPADPSGAAQLNPSSALPSAPAGGPDAPREASAHTPEPLITSDAVDADAIFSPSFGPTGTSVFFHAQRRDASALKRADTSPDGAVLRIATIVDDGAKNYHVQLSPDGSRVAFDSDRDGVRGVYVAAADGRNARRVSGQGHAAAPRWSPDGTRLAFVRAEPARPSVWNLWVLAPDSGDLVRLTDHPFGQALGGSWFADGHRIAYSHEDRLVVLDMRTSHSTIYPSPRAGMPVQTPAVSPDGRRIIFQVFRDGAWLLDLENGSSERVLDDPSAEEFTWSPDGREVAFHSRRNGASGLWKMAPR